MRKSLLLLIICLLLNGESSALGSSFNTNTKRQLSNILRAVNSGREETIRKFITANYSESALGGRSPQDATAFWMLNYKYSHGFDLRRLEKVEGSEISALLQARLTEQFFRLSFKIEPTQPYRIQNITFLPIELPDGMAKGKKPGETQIARILDAYMQKLVAADVFSGEVLVAKDANQIFRRAYGMADESKSQPNQPETSFNLASMSKMFTAVSIAELVAEGKLSFEDKVGKLLPDYPNKEVGEKVTVHQLLTHTSGMGNTFTRRPKNPLLFEPGTKFQYSTDGFLVLGLIIEKISAMKYADYVREHVFKPAGMVNSGALEGRTPPLNRAVGYSNVDYSNGKIDLKNRKSTSFMGSDNGTSGGGSSSTVEDLLLFSLALRQYKLLSREYTNLVLTGKVPTSFDPNIKYGYGTFDRRINGVRIVGHGGDAPGVSSAFEMYPELGYTVIVLANRDQSVASAVAMKIRMMLTGK
jgi:CubicO group peptidase (beta-lactamase class C family)